ncbi:flagellar outer dynein arm light chain 6 [Pavlovales sp. CCMP2436]|nr:flagellar outer dynein arm light chain 6 [Pavlovales sp. CCMP2436]
MEDDARSKLKITIEHSDMTEEMQAQLKEIVADAFVKHTVYKDLATQVKQVFDVKYPPPDNKATSGVYHCVVGSNFAVSVTHETHYACHLKCNNVSIVLFRSKDSPFD